MNQVGLLEGALWCTKLYYFSERVNLGALLKTWLPDLRVFAWAAWWVFLAIKSKKHVPTLDIEHLCLGRNFLPQGKLQCLLGEGVASGF